MQRLTAPAKLTLSLRVLGTRPDGYHLLDAEMVSVDLADVLEFRSGDGDGVDVVDETAGGTGVSDLDGGPSNLVRRALAAVGRRAAVRLVKRIPVGAGLGGGSADAAAVLRWAGCHDPSVGVGLGSDVPFCMVGGRARVQGVGEEVEPLPFEARRYLLLLPPLRVDTAAAYRAFDTVDVAERARRLEEDGGNDLEAAALSVTPALALWRSALAEATGLRPRLAGSGAAWFVDDNDGSLAATVGERLVVGDRAGPVLSVHTVAASSDRSGSHPDATAEIP